MVLMTMTMRTPGVSDCPSPEPLPPPSPCFSVKPHRSEGRACGQQLPSKPDSGTPQRFPRHTVHSPGPAGKALHPCPRPQGCNDHQRPRQMIQTLDLDLMYTKLDSSWAIVKDRCVGGYVCVGLCV